MPVFAPLGILLMKLSARVFLCFGHNFGFFWFQKADFSTLVIEIQLSIVWLVQDWVGEFPGFYILQHAICFYSPTGHALSSLDNRRHRHQV
jgi:hypothetical protein